MAKKQKRMQGVTKNRTGVSCNHPLEHVTLQSGLNPTNNNVMAIHKSLIV